MADNPFSRVNPYSAYTNPDWNEIMNNRYFQAAAASPNVNFRAASTSQVTSPYSIQDTQAASANYGGGIPVTTAEQQSSGGMTFGEGALATAIFGGGALLLLKTGKFSKLLNKGKSLIGKNGFANDKITKLSAIKTEDGIRFLLPGKTEVVKKPELAEFMRKNGIEFTKAQQEYNAGSSTLTRFDYDGYNVFLEDGKIVRISLAGKTENCMKALSEAGARSPKYAQYQSIQDILAELGKSTEANAEILGKAKNIRFTNTFGDNTLLLSMPKYGDRAQLEELTALKRYKFGDSEIQALKLSEKEYAFANDDFQEGKKIGEEFIIGKHSYVIDGQRCNFEGNNLVSVVDKNGNSYEEGTVHFINFYDKNRKKIDAKIANVYDKHKNIEIGTIISV